MRRCFVFLVCVLAGACAQAEPPSVSEYNVVWDTPGPDASASMPIGNGELGLNVWTGPNGDVVFYISRTDAWSEACRLMKLGRVRLMFDPPLVEEGRAFTQTLDLAAGTITVRTSKGDDEASVTVFVHPDQPVAYVTGKFDTARTVRVSLEVWRTERKVLTGTGPDAELTSSWTMHSAPMEVWESADVVAEGPARVVWYHRNEHSVVPMSIEHQGLGDVAGTVPDLLLNRTFGGSITAEPAGTFRKRRATQLETIGERRGFELKIVGHCEQTPTAEEWLEKVAWMASAADAPGDALARTRAWWEEFWDRSYVFVEESRGGTGIPANSHQVTLGRDSSGGNVFRGELGPAGIVDHPLEDLRALAEQPREKQRPAEKARVVSFDAGAGVGATAPGSAAMRFEQGFTAEAWIKPATGLQAARILDKVTPGQPDGFLFDIQPGGTLRVIVGESILTAPGAVTLGEWNHVAATYDPAKEQLRLFVAGREVARSAGDEAPTGSRITRGYILQRWMQACAGRGNAPIKFNGSIFTVDAKHTNGNDRVSPDYRRWGDCFWWQNTRLPYYPMLAAGDFEMMDPLFNLYERVRPACEARAQVYHGVAGAYFPETMSVFGLYSNGDYGWNREGHATNEVLCPWWQYAWNQGTELVAMMLDRYEYTQDEAFARDRLIPMARSVLSYFDTRFERDERGKLRITPTQALETYWYNVVNDMPSVAGLRDVTARLRALPASLGGEEDRALWERLAAALPELPTRAIDGVKMYAPAEKFKDQRNNVETPELAHVFPHRLVGVGSPAEQVEMAREAYRRRHDKATHGWTQDGQFAALLGLTDEARANILAKARNSHKNHRFPAMWGPNFDWLPDQTHGGNLMGVLQCMLLQPVGEKLYLLPAWPREWDVSFKLHAPGNTVVECEYRGGKVERLVVTPAERARDVVLE